MWLRLIAPHLLSNDPQQKSKGPKKDYVHR